MTEQQKVTGNPRRGIMCPVSPNFGENAADPFAVGRVVKLRMLVVSNSAATRTSAVRTITIAEPIE